VHAGTIVNSDYTLVDYNRTGVPLIEIVSEPDLRSAEEARIYMEKLKAILEYIDVSNCKMEEGNLRCDANISLRPRGQEKFGTKAEMKNLNSFRALEGSLAYEAARQEEILSEGGRVIQETRSWDDAKGITASLRNKEQAEDYRYLPEPDLVPIVVDPARVEEIRKSLPELPDVRKKRLMKDYGLSEYDTDIIIATKAMADYFDEVVSHKVDAKSAANWLMGDVAKHLNNEGLGIEACPVTADKLSGMLTLIDKGTISGKIAKTVFEEMWASGKDAETIVKEKGLVQISDEGAIIAIVDAVLAANPQSVADFKAGKEKAIGFLVGQTMKQTKGRANPELVNKLLRERISQ
jgi:aspartyl-tRNA(Asn)/glutamyl-tRNA(Gln) amidotransferase subunit B